MRVDLMAHLKAATEGSEGLDRAIQEALGDDALGCSYMDSDRPHWTASLDDALTLVPDGYSPNINGPVLHRPGWGCDLRLLRTNSFPDGAQALAPTPALAVVIASLRVRLAAEIVAAHREGRE